MTLSEMKPGQLFWHCGNLNIRLPDCEVSGNRRMAYWCINHWSSDHAAADIPLRPFDWSKDQLPSNIVIPPAYAASFQKPEPSIRPWAGRSEVPADIRWLRLAGHENMGWRSVKMLTTEGIQVHDGFPRWIDLSRSWEWSADGKTWQPCGFLA